MILVFVILYFYIYFVFYSNKKNLVECESYVVFIETLFEIVIYFQTKSFNILF